jgi:hypothetical protein
MTTPYSTSLILASSLLTLLALSAGAAKILFRFAIPVLDNDTIFLYTAGETAARTGIPSLPFLTNSIAGLDIVAWSHFLQGIFYGLIFRIGNIPIFHMYSITAIQWLLATVTTLLIIHRLLQYHHLTSPYNMLLISLAVFYEPLFSTTILGPKIMMHLAYICAITSAYLLLHSLTPSTSSRNQLMMSGLLAVSAALMFPSLGIPAALGITLATFLTNRPFTNPTRILIFIGSITIPLIITAIYVWLKLGSAQLFQLVTTINYYSSSVANPGALSYLLQQGYFATTLITSTYSPSLLPVSLLATTFSFWHRAHLPPSAKNHTIITLSCTLGWLGLAIIASTHFSATLMAWIWPLIAIQLFIFWRYRAHYPRSWFTFASATMITITAQIFYQIALHHLSLYVAAGISISILVIVSIVAITVYLHPWHPKQNISDKFFFVALASLTIFSLQANAHTLKLYGPPLIQTLSSAKPSPATTFVKTVKNFTQIHTQPGQTVLTNLPISDLFPPNTNFQIIYHYRNLLSGARSQAADQAVLINTAHSQPKINNYITLDNDTLFSFRNFVYKITLLQHYSSDITLALARPVSIQSMSTPQNHPNAISNDQIRSYLDWRKKVNLPIR